MFTSMKYPTSLKVGHVGSKTMSLGQILEKHCLRSIGHIFSLMLVKLGQHVFLSEISDELEKGYVGSNTRSLGKILEKTLCML